MPMRQRDGRTVKLHVVATMIACLVQVDLPPVGGAQVSVALDCACVYGHSPIWDAALKRLHFVDIEGQKVHSYDPSVNSHQKVDMLERVGCVVPYVQNRLLVAGEERIYQLGVEGKHRVLRRLPGHTAIVPMRECVPVVLNPDETGYKIAPGARFHSGSCDDKGRLWLSFKRTTGRCDTAFYSLTAPPEWAPELDPGGVIHQYGPNAVLRERPEVSCNGPCNGIAWSLASGGQAERVTMYFVDSASQSIKAMAYDRDSGIPDPDSCRTVFTLAAALAREDEDAGGGERANKHENEHAAHDSRLQAAKRTTIDETDAVVENDAPVAAGTERSCLHEQAPRSLLASGELGGLALDSQGYIWVPLYASGCMPPGSPASARQSSLAPSSWVLRVHGVTGEVERSISLGTWRPTACAFGGDALDDLYITTRSSKHSCDVGACEGEDASASGRSTLQARDLVRSPPAPEKGDGVLLRLRVEGVRGQHSLRIPASAVADITGAQAALVTILYLDGVIMAVAFGGLLGCFLTITPPMMTAMVEPEHMTCLPTLASLYQHVAHYLLAVILAESKVVGLLLEIQPAAAFQGPLQQVITPRAGPAIAVTMCPNLN